MNRKSPILILLALILASCAKTGIVEPVGQPSDRPSASGDIDASCSVVNMNDSGAGPGIATRAIIGQTTITSLNANFIKLDESVTTGWKQEDYVMKPFAGWEAGKTTILDASILSSPDNTADIHFRSIYFNPRQTYQYDQYDPNDPSTASTDDDIVVGYVSRMVGWYPKTYRLPVDANGKPVSNALFSEASDTYRVLEDGTVCVRFPKMLDGETDVMMTDMREGRYDLRAFGHRFKNNDSSHDYDIQPYGHQFANRFDDTEGYDYLNYFTFKHYLTGIRLYVRTNESDLSLISWKQINDVVFTNQPSTVTIPLPTRQAEGSGNSTIAGLTDIRATLPIEGVVPVFGGVGEDGTLSDKIIWEDEENMSVIKTAMAANDPDHPEFAELPAYPVMMNYGIVLDEAYLGYMLVRPDQPTPIEIHTDAGVFTGEIPVTAKYIDENGQERKAEILKAGYIYKIVIDIKTDGSLDVIIGNEDFESFRDLAPYNKNIESFEYSNCYVVKPDMLDILDENGKDTGNDYAGFYFHAMVAGRGDMGALSVTGAELYPEELYFDPVSARILWQDAEYLIEHVELIHGYVRFTLNKDCWKAGTALAKGGNAVIAVYDRDGNIIWSWHIWVAPSELNDIDYTIDGRSFSMMNMNLGANAAIPDSDPLSTYGLYYQWGRKDPLPVPPSYDYGQSDRTTKTYYYMDQGARNSVKIMMEAAPTVETGARNPLDIIASAQLGEEYQYDWLFNSVDQLWGYSPNAGNVVKKTIYDPCPYGYRVPDDEVDVLFDHCRGQWDEHIQTSDYGITLKGATDIGTAMNNFFPYSGWRGRDVGRTDRDNTWYMVGTLGDYQNARIDKNPASKTYNHRGRTLLVKGGRITIPNPETTYSQYMNTGEHGNRASAAPVRCVRYGSGPEQEP